MVTVVQLDTDAILLRFCLIFPSHVHEIYSSQFIPRGLLRLNMTWILGKSLILVELGGIQLTMEPTVEGHILSKLWTFFPVPQMLLHQIQKCLVDSYL